MDLHHFSPLFVQTKNHRILHHRKGPRQFFPSPIAKTKVSRVPEMFSPNPTAEKSLILQNNSEVHRNRPSNVNGRKKSPAPASRAGNSPLPSFAPLNCQISPFRQNSPQTLARIIQNSEKNEDLFSHIAAARAGKSPNFSFFGKT